ncbi:MAG TPA: 2-dehydropantoate 2-reductase [Brevundimonas sp.]|jgi:2-dehydropantoate 2-reductase
MTASKFSIAVVGPGAVGGTIAAWLSRSPLVSDLTLCARSPLDRLVVETPDGTVIEARPRVVTDPGQITVPVDWVLIATKAYDVAGAALWLKPLLGPDTRVAVLQNGVEHAERFAPFLSAARILPVIVDIPAERTAPGRIHHRRNGTVTVPAGEAGEAFVTLFAESIIEASTANDFLTAAWTKLSLNCAGAVNALTGEPGGVVRAEGVADLMREMVWECVRVGRAVGADLGDHIPDWVVERAMTSPGDSVNSLLGDRLAGRPMEWDARNGVIVRLGQVHGVATPVNAMASTLLAAIGWPPSA